MLTVSDTDDLFDFAGNFKETFLDFGYDKETIRNRLLDANCIGVGLWISKKLVGTISCSITGSIFNDSYKCAFIFNIALLPKYSGYCRVLFNDLKSRLKDIGVQSISIGLNCCQNEVSLDKLYTKLGLEKQVIIYTGVI